MVSFDFKADPFYLGHKTCNTSDIKFNPTIKRVLGHVPRVVFSTMRSFSYPSIHKFVSLTV